MLYRKFDDGARLLARLCLAGLILSVAASKFSGGPGWTGLLPLTLAPAVLEAAGGLLLALGLKVRIVAFLFAIRVLIAALGHFVVDPGDPVSRFDDVVHLFHNLGVTAAYVLLSVSGAGRYSLDALNSPRPTPR